MPLFDWSADRTSAVVTRHAWIYLAVSLPLTTVVLFVWIGWLVLSEKMHRLTDENIRASLLRKTKRDDEDAEDEGADAQSGSVQAANPVAATISVNTATGKENSKPSRANLMERLRRQRRDPGALKHRFQLRKIHVKSPDEEQNLDAGNDEA
ncbi:MAG: hypothetical protein Q9163_004372, partial [Psora crenata]